jgi:hypothetical protein
LDFDGFDDLEATIRAAGSYIVPSDDLRPRVIETARERASERHNFGRLLGCAVTCLILWSVYLPLRDDIDRWRDQWTGPSSAQMYARANGLRVKSELGPSWALAEAFTQLRQAQAQVFGRAYAKSK